MVFLALGLGLIFVTSGSYRFGVVTSMILAIISLSLVLLTGYLGQISLAQAAFAGAAGFALSKFTTDWGVPFPLSMILSSLVAALLGILISIPALRIRGAQLAVVTLAAGVAIQSFVFNNPQPHAADRQPRSRTRASSGSTSPCARAATSCAHRSR